MTLKLRWQTLAIWFAVSCIAALSASLVRPSAHVQNEYFPIGNDSFYHAARILESVRDPAAFYQFDPKIHAPEGSLLVWPWGYDYAMAKLVRAGVAMGLNDDPLLFLLWIPVGAVFVGAGLMIWLGRRLSLEDWPLALAGLCLALSQTTQVLYAFGQIDHHYVEHMFILASLAAGLSWFKSPTVATGVALGATFGLALGVHNGLFILQATFLAAAAAHWLQGQVSPAGPTIALVTSLLVSALAMLLPSLPFQEGQFAFYTLSWFHLYIACCTALVLLLLARLQPTRRSVLVLVALAAVLLLPLLKQIQHAESFVSGSLGMLDQIMEMRSPLKLLLDGDGSQLTYFYSLLIWLMPATFVLCVVRLWRERQSPRLLFWIACVFGLALLTTQLRMHYFGGFALYLPWLIVVQEYAAKRSELRKKILLGASLLLLLAHAPVIRHSLVQQVPFAGEDGFIRMYPVFPALRKACAEDPGVVLADTNAGHYIRYFTDCSVIANNFLLTEQQFQKVDEVFRLFSLQPSEFLKQAPYVKYVLARAGDIEPKPDGRFSYKFFGDSPPTLPQFLLLGRAADIPPQFKQLYEVSVEMRGATRLQQVPYAKLYKVDRGVAEDASVNDVSQ